MTMRIAMDQELAGQPISRVRLFLQRTSGRHPDAAWAAEHFGVTVKAARRVLETLAADGYLEPADERLWYRGVPAWNSTEKGIKLANASAAAPITRGTADRLLAELLVRVDEVNAAPYAFTVGRAFVFGSYLDAAVARLGDLDAAIDFVPRFGDRHTQYEYGQERVRLAVQGGRSMPTIMSGITWPWLEVYQYLRGRSRALSLLDVGEIEKEHREFLLGVPHRQVFPLAPDARE